MVFELSEGFGHGFVTDRELNFAHAKLFKNCSGVLRGKILHLFGIVWGRCRILPELLTVYAECFRSGSGGVREWF